MRAAQWEPFKDPFKGCGKGGKRFLNSCNQLFLFLSTELMRTWVIITRILVKKSLRKTSVFFSNSVFLLNSFDTSLCQVAIYRLGNPSLPANDAQAGAAKTCEAQAEVKSGAFVNRAKGFKMLQEEKLLL